MKVVTALLLLAASAVSALPSNNYVLHEARRNPGMRRGVWKRTSRAAGDSIIPLRIGLTQSNLHVAYDRLMDVSHPSSESYGKHLTQEEVIDLFAPQEESISAVRDWLIQSGVNQTRIRHYKTKGWLSIDMPVREAETLFHTQYHEVEHQGKIRLGCDEYHVPKHLQEHIDYITPGVKLSPPLRKRSIKTPYGRKRKSFQILPDPSSFFHIEASLDLPLNLQGCAQNFTPVCYQALYSIPANNTALPGNSVGLYESGDTYAQEDSNAFFATYAPYIPNGTHPIPAFIDGAVAPVPQDSEFNTGESEIDIDIISSLVYPQTITLYQTDDQIEAGTTYGFLNTFLDALDGSYCNYTAYGITGDTPGIDPTYPDTAPGGYNQTEMCGVYTPAKVISISYGLAEADYPKRYIERQCNEWMKLGLQGHTVLLASGDYGVASFPGDVSESGCLSGGALNETIYNPDSVSSCPFMISVGATQLQPNQTINDPESALQTALAPAPDPASRFSSAGGFSNYFTAPAYQAAAIATYFAAHDPGHPYYIANDEATNLGENGGLYNRAGRGFPDISANGANFRAFVNGINYHNYGTSLAAPVWAAVVTLLNQERQAAGKGPIGFMNPVLYTNPGALIDIKNGSNANCGSSGFSAVEGWDPVTGLGTPSYPKLLDLFLSLP